MRSSRRRAAAALAALTTASGLVAGCGGQPNRADLEKRIDDFHLPHSYHLVKNAPKPAFNTDPPKYYAFRVYEVPPGVDACRDVRKAFEKWAVARVHAFGTQTGCSFNSRSTSVDLSEEVRAGTPGNEHRVVVEMFVSGHRYSF